MALIFKEERDLYKALLEGETLTHPRFGDIRFESNGSMTYPTPDFSIPRNWSIKKPEPKTKTVTFYECIVSISDAYEIRWVSEYFISGELYTKLGPSKQIEVPCE